MGEVPSVVLKSLLAEAPVSDGGPRSIREEAPQMLRRIRGEEDGADASAYWSYNFRDPIKSIRDPLSVVKAPSAMVNTSLAKEGPILNAGRDNSKVVNAPAPLKR